MTLRPRLMVSKHPLADDDVPWPADYRRADSRDRDLIVAWLLEQGIGEEVTDVGYGLQIWTDEGDRFLVIPLKQYERRRNETE